MIQEDALVVMSFPDYPLLKSNYQDYLEIPTHVQLIKPSKMEVGSKTYVSILIKGEW